MNNVQHPALKLLTDMLAIPSPSGYEQGMARYIRESLSAMGYAYQMDAAGNVLVRLAGKQADAPLCCFAAHMDEIGVVVTAIDADGSLGVQRLGGLYPWKQGEGPVDIVTDRGNVQGILSMGSTHSASAGNKNPDWSQVKIITGLSPAQLAKAGVRVGSAAVPAVEQRGPIVFGDPNDPLVAAWTFDDRMGCITLLRLLEQLKDETITPSQATLIAFTVQEEVGGNGAKYLCQQERPELFVAVDGAPIPPGSDLSLDGRPALWSKDRLAVYDQAVIHEFQKAAQMAGTEAQLAAYDSTASDASLAFYAGGPARIACFGHVRENSHGYEVARLSVFDNVLNTLVHYVQAEPNDFSTG